MNVADGWVYYNKLSDGFYKLRTNGAGKQKIIGTTGIIVEKFNVHDGWIYFCAREMLTNYGAINHDNQNGKLYKMRADGTELTVLSYNIRMDANLNVVDDWIYYTDKNIGGNAETLCKIRTDGSEKIVIE